MSCVDPRRERCMTRRWCQNTTKLSLVSCADVAADVDHTEECGCSLISASFIMLHIDNWTWSCGLWISCQQLCSRILTIYQLDTSCARGRIETNLTRIFCSKSNDDQRMFYCVFIFWLDNSRHSPPLGFKSLAVIWRWFDFTPSMWLQPTRSKQ